MWKISNTLIKISVLALFSACFSTLTWAVDLKLEAQKVQKLLLAVEQSGATFIRNGSEHPAKKARKHLEFKYKKAKSSFFFFKPDIEGTAREFIDKIASKSSTSGKVYQMRLPSGVLVNTKAWLDEKLKIIEGKAPDQKKEEK